MSKISVTIKWNSNSYLIENLTDESSVLDLKLLIEKETRVKPARQKLLNLKLKGKFPADDVLLKDLKIKPKMKIMMMGSVEEDIEDIEIVPEGANEVVNDLDIGDEDEEIKLENMETHLAKIENRVRNYKIKELNPPRAGKKLLVLDVDYTIYDHRSTAENISQLSRPYLHEFLAQAYEDYDIGIWSATSMKWIDVKMKELGVTDNPNYKICFHMDHGAMITVHTEKYGISDTKPLGVVWGKYPDFYSPQNTIMFDDLRRNFLMNPQTGLKIAPYRNSRVAKDTDNELKNLSGYLKCISKLDSFTRLKHKHWRNYRKRRHERRHSSSNKESESSAPTSSSDPFSKNSSENQQE